jgi:hypothetical protein
MGEQFFFFGKEVVYYLDRETVLAILHNTSRNMIKQHTSTQLTTPHLGKVMGNPINLPTNMH